MCIRDRVNGAINDKEARTLARVITSSSLVKTAIHGCDPNWGRIIAAAGRAGVLFAPDRLSLWIGPYLLLQSGEPLDFDHNAASEYIKARMIGEYLVDDLVSIRLVVGSGKGEAVAWGCDLSDKYVRINADYTT